MLYLCIHIHVYTYTCIYKHITSILQTYYKHIQTYKRTVNARVISTHTCKARCERAHYIILSCLRTATCLVPRVEIKNCHTWCAHTWCAHTWCAHTWCAHSRERARGGGGILRGAASAYFCSCRSAHIARRCQCFNSVPIHGQRCTPARVGSGRAARAETPSQSKASRQTKEETWTWKQPAAGFLSRLQRHATRRESTRRWYP